VHPPVVISHPRENTTEPIRFDPSMLRWFCSPQGQALAQWLSALLALATLAVTIRR
jgi:hypothetical protein